MKTAAGRIELIVGKTTQLITQYEKFVHVSAPRLIAIVTSEKDTRYKDHNEGAVIATHHRAFKIPATHATDVLADIQDDLMAYDVILVDEGHLFPDVHTVTLALANAGKTVIISALDSDYRMHKFRNIANIVPETVQKLCGRCWYCDKNAAFSLKIAGNRANTIEIGGSEMYRAVCRGCHRKYNKF